MPGKYFVLVVLMASVAFTETSYAQGNESYLAARGSENRSGESDLQSQINEIDKDLSVLKERIGTFENISRLWEEARNKAVETEQSIVNTEAQCLILQSQVETWARDKSRSQDNISEYQGRVSVCVSRSGRLHYAIDKINSELMSLKIKVKAIEDESHLGRTIICRAAVNKACS